jgi:putative membrane protein insertion efficiency factor
MIARILVLLLRVYQRTLSPLIGPVCRFSPSCSNYMVTCIQRFGAARGLWLGTRRLARCHPFHPGGIDLPPEVTATGHSRSEDADERDPSRSLPPRSFKQTP